MWPEMAEPGWNPDSSTHSEYVVCLVLYTPQMSRKWGSSFHYVLKRKHELPPFTCHSLLFCPWKQEGSVRTNEEKRTTLHGANRAWEA